MHSQNTNASIEQSGHVPSTSSSELDPDFVETLDEKHGYLQGDATSLRQERRKDSVRTASDSDEDHAHTDGKETALRLGKTRTHTLGRLKLRAQNDQDPIDWWFASTAIPLIAATFAPMANMLSIAALVVYWRDDITATDPAMKYSNTVPQKDPEWCLALNAASLICGFIGNLFLLFNFTKRVRYIVALPVTIIFFYVASGILIGIIVSMDRYAPPTQNQVYSQGYWHAVIAAILYMINSMLLMVNMLGYFLGHYPQHFTLTDEQRNLILQTMLFFLWLAGGAGVFTTIQHGQDGGQKWTYPDALYFCDVTILTIGFGDFYATNDVGRGLVFPFSVGGTIILGLMVSSLHKFARELSRDKVVRKHVEKRRVDTLSRAITVEQQVKEKSTNSLNSSKPLAISAPLKSDAEHIQHDLDEAARKERENRRAINFEDPKKEDFLGTNTALDSSEPAPSQFFLTRQRTLDRTMFQKSLRSLTLPLTMPVSVTANSIRRVTNRSRKQVIMLEERDRFNAMRSIQRNAHNFNRYYALTVSLICFGLLWCLGAMVFYFAEAETQDLNYFQGLYFCYVSLLTIGYGDLSPKSNAGKAFFVVWSLIAVPTMTILVSDLGDTVIGSFKRGLLKNDLGLTSAQGSSQGGFWRKLWKPFKTLTKPPAPRKQRNLTDDIQLEAGRTSTSELQEPEAPPKTIEELANENMSEATMMQRLAYSIRHVAEDLKKEPGKKYKYEDWVEFTRLIRFSKLKDNKGKNALKQLEYDEEIEGVVEWDWLDERSPMTSEQSESEWILDRLCESLLRIFKRSDVLGAFAGDPQSPLSMNQNPLFGTFAVPTHAQADIDPLSPADGRDNTEFEQEQESKNVNAVTKWFRGEAANDHTPQWSKRAKARMAVAEQETSHADGRRRSSTSMHHKRTGPFAAIHARRGHAQRSASIATSTGIKE